MKFNHYIMLYGVRVLVQLDINIDALANDLGAKAADNASGKAGVRFGNVKARIDATDLQAITAAKGARKCTENKHRIASAIADNSGAPLFPCVLCGQNITDGKPCGCGARKGTRATLLSGTGLV